MPIKTWGVEEEVEAPDFQTYIQNQVTPTFVSLAQRDAQWPTPPDGAFCVTTDSGAYWQRISNTWYKPFSIQAHVPYTGVRNGITTATTDIVSSDAVWLPAGRRISIVSHFYCEFYGNGGSTGWKMDGVVGGRTAFFWLANAPAILHGEMTITPAAGNHTFTITAAAHDNTMNIRGDIEPAYFEIRDQGAA